MTDYTAGVLPSMKRALHFSKAKGFHEGPERVNELGRTNDRLIREGFTVRIWTIGETIEAFYRKPGPKRARFVVVVEPQILAEIPAEFIYVKDQVSLMTLRVQLAPLALTSACFHLENLSHLMHEMAQPTSTECPECEPVEVPDPKLLS